MNTDVTAVGASWISLTSAAGCVFAAPGRGGRRPCFAPQEIRSVAPTPTGPRSAIVVARACCAAQAGGRLPGLPRLPAGRPDVRQAARMTKLAPGRGANPLLGGGGTRP